MDPVAVDIHAYVRLYNSAGWRLQHLRKNKGLTQKGLSLSAKLSHNTVHKLEAEEHQLSALTAIALASVLECTPEWLLFGVTYE